MIDSTTQAPPFSLIAGFFLSLLFRSLPPLQKPVNTYENGFSSNCLLDELDSATLIYTLSRNGSTSPLATPFERFSDVVGGESHIQGSYNPKKVSELEPLPSLSEEPKRVHHEKSSYLDEAGKTRQVESPIQGLREVESNFFQTLFYSVVMIRLHK